MKRVAFRQEVTGSASLDRSQRMAQMVGASLDTLKASLRDVPFLDGVLVPNVVIGTSDTLITHGLGRPVRGYIATRVRTFAPWRESTSQPSDTSQRFSLIASGSSATVDLWFF